MGLFNDRYKKLRGEKEEENKKGGVLNQRAQNIYDSRAANKYDEEERKEAEGDGSLSPFSTYRTANRERAEAAVTGYRQALETEKLARQSYMQRFGVMDAEDRSDKFMDPALSAASKAERMRQNTEKARRMFGVHEDADDYAAAARKAANEATARIRKQAGEIDRAAGEIDRIYGAGTAKAMKEDLGEIGKSAWERSAFADNDKLVSDFYNARGGLTISGKTAAERRAQETKLEQERERLVKLANQGEEVVEETPGVTVGDMYENPFPLRKGTTGEYQEYIDEYGRATGRTVRERIAEIDAELNAYRMYQSAADKLVTGVAAQYEDAKKNGVKRQPTIAELDALEGLSPEEKDAAVRRMMAGGDADVDALFEMTDQDYRDYYNTVPFVAWYASKTTFGDIPGVNRSLETEGKLADNTNVNFEYLTDEEKKALIWVLHNEGGEQVNKILADMQPELDRRSVTQRAEEQRERNIKFFGGAGGTAAALAAFGVPGAVIAALPSETKGKVLTDVFNSAASVPASVASAPLSFLDSLAQSIPDADGVVRRNPYGTYQRPRKWAETVRSDTAEDLEGLTGGGKILGMGLGDVYMAGMSAADSVVGSMAMGPAYSVIMGMGAASDEMNRLAEAGASNGQAVVGGLLAGVAETVFEHVSLEYFAKNFINGVPENWADFIKKTLVQAGVEGSEEVVTEIANTLSNSQVMGTQSDWNKAIREYTDAGMTREEAYRRVWVDKAYELWKSGASGALSGGMMAGGVAGVVRDNMQRAAETRQIGADITGANKGRALSKQALDIAASGNVDAKTAKALEKAAEAYDKKNDNKRAGKLFRAVTDAVNEGITDAEAQETAAGKVASVLLGDGVDYVKASDPVSGDAVTVDRAAPIARTEGGSVYMNTDRGEVALEDLAFEDDAVRDMIYSISEYGPEYANMVLTNYGGEDVGTYLGGMREGILTGQYGDLGEELYDFNSLSRADQNLALKIGQAIRADQVAAERAAARNATLTATNNDGLTRVFEAHVGDKKMKGASGTVGEVYFDRGVEATSDLDRANVDFAKAVANVYGNKIVFFDSTKRGDLKNANGFHVGADGSIWVDLRAGERRQGLVAYTIAHELTHDAEQWAPETYRKYVDFLLKNYGEAGVSVDRMVRNKMAAMNTNDYDAALRDVVADASEKFLLDSDAMEKLAELRKTDEGLFKRIVSWIRAQIAKIKDAYNKMKASGEWEQTEASRALEAVGEKIGEIEKMWSGLISEAAQGRKAAVERAAKKEAKESGTEIPTVTKFSMKSPVEQTKTMIAWHNISKESINDAIELGGLAMPSFAVMPSDRAHTTYGDVSVVAYKNSIDPKRSSSQKIFAGDGWTPVFPEVRYKINKEAADSLSEKVYGLLNKAGVKPGDLRLALDSTNITDMYDRRGGDFAKNYRDNYGMKLAFIEDTGRHVTVPTQEKQYTSHADIATLKKIAKAVNLDNLDSFGGYENEMTYEPILRRIMREYAQKKYGDTDGFRGRKLVDMLYPADEPMSFADVDGLFYAARQYMNSKETRQTDISKLEKRIDSLMQSKKVQSEYDEWLKNLGEGLVERKGIRNNRELYTSSGNRRSWDALYDEYSLENIVRAMKSQPQQGRTQFLSGAGSVKGAALEAFDSLEQVRSSQNRLVSELDDDTKKAYDDFSENVKNLANKIADDPFTGSDMLADILSHAKTKEGIERYLRREYDFLRVQDRLDLERVAENIYALGQEANTLPMEYFEAKVYRAFPFSEAAAVVVPQSLSKESVEKLREQGANVLTYKDGDNEDRLAKVNSVKGVQFSTRTGTSTSTRAVVERALETLKDGPEKTALTAYLRTLEQIEAQQKAAAEARAANDPATEKAAKDRIETLSARLRRMETAPALQNVAAVSDIASLNRDVRNLGRLLRLQGKQTGGAIALKSSIEGVASDLMKEHGIRRGKAELVEMLDRFYRDMTKEVNAETLNREYMISAAQPVADWLVENEPVTKEVNREVADVLREIKGAKIRVNDQQRGDIINKYGNFETWRRSLYPYVIVTSDPGAMTLDSFWSDLAESHPEYFDPETSWGDQGPALAGVLSDLRSQRIKEYYTPDEAFGWLRESAAQEVAEAFWRIKPYETVADKYERQIRELKASHSYRSVGEILRNEREKIWRRGYDVAVQRAQRAELRRRIRTLYENISNRLLKPKNERYVPYDLRQAVAQVLSIINTDSGRSATLSAKLGEMRQQYETILEMPKFQEHYDPDLAERIKDLQEVVKAENGDGNLSISDMTFEQLDAVYQTIKWFDKTMREEVKMRDLTINGINRDVPITEVRDKWTREIEGAKKKTSIPEMIEMWKWSPEAYFETIAGFKKDSYSSAIFNLLNESQRKMYRMIMEGNFYLKEFLQDEKFLRKITDTKKGLIDTGLKNKDGEKIKVTRDIAHALYLGLANANYRLHVMSSGGTFPDLEKYYAGKSNAYSEGNGTRYAGLAGKAMTDLRAEIDENIEVFKEEREKARILQDFEAVEAYNKAIRAEWEKWGELVGEKHNELLDIRDKIQSQFDAQELRYLERVHDYYNIFTKARMNEASNQRFGFDIADEPDYIQIITDPNFRTESVANRAREMTNVANKGFTQRRIQAKNPLIFAGLTDMVKDHLKATAAYTAFLNPIYDMNRLIGPSEGGMEYTQSVRHALEENFGKTGKDYLDNLLINAQGGSFGKVKSDTIDRMFEWGRSKVGSAALNMNLNTAFVQTGSLLTAISELGWRPVMKAFPMMFAKSKANVINENTPLYWMRSTNEMTAMLENARQIRKKRTVAKKLLHPITSMIQFFDNRTVNALWYASEFYVDENTDLKKGTPEYINAVTDAFNKTVERTQPNYTALQRPEILRNENALLKTIEMFKTQRYQNRNMLYMNTARALQFAKDLKNGVEGVTKQDVKRARIKAANTWASQIMSSAYISLIKYIIPGLLLFRLDPWKDKETGELTPQSVLTKLLDDMLNSFFGNDTITSELYNIIGSVVFERKYYAGLSTGYMESINEGLEKIGDVAAKLKAGKITQKNAARELDDMAEKFSGWFGIPYRNARNLIAGIYSHVQNVAAGNIFKLDLSGTNAQFGRRMLKAYHNGDVEQFKEIRGLFQETKDKTAREVADSALLDAVYEEWAAGAIDDREALDILEDCLAKPPKTENDERIQIGRWEVKKTNESLPAGADKETYGAMKDLRESFAAYVYPAPGTDRASTGAAAKAMIKQYREWGYDDAQIRDAIRETFKDQYVTLKPSEQREIKRYIVKLYSFTKDNNGDSYDASELIDKWKKTDAQIAAENAAKEEDEREFG